MCGQQGRTKHQEPDPLGYYPIGGFYVYSMVYTKGLYPTHETGGSNSRPFRSNRTT
ncbi:hypothetical protein CLS_15300 [[Clostridium] cf. saccharolyticum K10]|nr:hypothetical protein CLS_15300 [[Clostridium] cf. saccharolyticum K10]